MAGVPYSSLRKNTPKDRGFRIVRIGLDREREELYARIDRRVDLMLEEGLEDEARRLWPLRHLNALNTVGYKDTLRQHGAPVFRCSDRPVRKIQDPILSASAGYFPNLPVHIPPSARFSIQEKWSEYRLYLYIRHR